MTRDDDINAPVSIPVGKPATIHIRTTKTPLGFRIRTKGGTEIEIVARRTTSFKFLPGVDVESVETFVPERRNARGVVKRAAH